jgi:hypothetical protein
MPPLTKDGILKAQDSKAVPVNVPEWGGEVFLRPMSGKEREVFDTRFVKDAAGMRVFLAVTCLCDASGSRIFGDEDASALEGKSSVALERVAHEAIRINGLLPPEKTEKN